jgi:hypothetical protein
MTPLFETFKSPQTASIRRLKDSSARKRLYRIAATTKQTETIPRTKWSRWIVESGNRFRKMCSTISEPPKNRMMYSTPGKITCRIRSRLDNRIIKSIVGKPRASENRRGYPRQPRAIVSMEPTFCRCLKRCQWAGTDWHVLCSDAGTS